MAFRLLNAAGSPIGGNISKRTRRDLIQGSTTIGKEEPRLLERREPYAPGQGTSPRDDDLSLLRPAGDAGEPSMTGTTVPLDRDVTDEGLAARVVRRDPAAFALLYDRYARPVYAMAAHLLGVAEADEVVQDVFLTLWQH